MRKDGTQLLRDAVAHALGGCRRAVLAVSGGVDSMTLLDVASQVMNPDRLTVATFDHGTGVAATAAVRLVARRARALGIECISGRATTVRADEASLRAARWFFLRSVAEPRQAVVCTGHTRDDQIETLLMRAMRGAHARGLAALYANSRVVRPLIDVSRATIVAYAAERGLSWVEDPTNSTRRYLRNRVRADLLPALRRADPSIDAMLLAIARDAAEWRRDVAAFCDEIPNVRMFDDGRGLAVPVAAFQDDPDRMPRLLWPELAGRVGAVLDRRGLERLAAFTVNSRVGARVQLSGGWEVVRGRNNFGLRQICARRATSASSVLSDGTRFGGWTFRAEASAPLTVPRDSWSAWLPMHTPLVVRPWQAGDFIVVRDGGSRRKVKDLLTRAGVSGHERAGWPVVVSGNDIIWIPGVRRTDAATARPGRPGLAFVCEYDNR